jgi:tetratricopeptide (TPR) repeat protein
MQPGDLVADRFEIDRRAGAGGMSVVWRARDRTTGGPVALKILGVPDHVATGRFQREGRVLAQLEHPAIVRFVAHGATESGERYLAMEWLDGEDLAERLLRADLTLPESMALASAVAGALAFAHSHGVVHRDIKPANLFLPDRRVDRVKLLDFGVARWENEAGLMTRTGFRIGTPAYMSPEQARGRGDLDARADVFALGAVLYECLTGKKAFAAEDQMAVLAKILLEEPVPAHERRPGVPEELSALVSRMLAKDPEDRPADGRAVLDELCTLEERILTPPVLEAARLPGALTGREQRLICVVLARDVPYRPGDGTDTLCNQHGGRLEPLADGAMLITLSRSGAATDLCVQAARLALALRERCPGALFAIATGRGVVSGALPVGEVIDAAARMLRVLGTDRTDLMPIVDPLATEFAERPPPTEEATPRSIRLDEITAGLLATQFEIGGDAEALELHGERDLGEDTRTLLGKPTPCVGRDPELATLTATFAACAGEPEARPVLITGAPGLGKSRLRYELVRGLAARGEPVEVWMGRGDPMSAGAPFGLVAAALRRACGIQNGEPPEVRHQKVRARVARDVAAAEVARVAEFLGELLGAPGAAEPSVQLAAARQDPMLMGDQMRRAFEDFLAAECAVQPVLIVLEDLHWGDLPTVKFIDSALRNLRDQPLMVLALARPDVHVLFPRLWADRGLQELRLGELTRKASERLCRRVLGDEVAADVVARLCERASGNAFYLEELIRQASEAGPERRLPETVLAMVEARIEAMEPEARRVLRAASVFGQVFWPGGVEALLGGAAEAALVRDWIGALVEREVVSRTGSGRWSGESEYRFRHGLVRDAAYAMLTELDRATGHRLAGDWLELMGESDAAVLAEHFERGSEPARAVGWYRKAAEQALEGDDFGAVIARAERGVSCGAMGETLGRLRLLQAEAHRWRGEVIEAERAALEAMRLLPAGDDAWCGAIEELSFASGPLGNRSRLVEAYQALVSLEPLSDPGSGARDQAAARLSSQLLYLGRVELCDALLAGIDRAALPSRDPGVQARIYGALASRANFGGNLDELLELSALSTARYAAAGDLRNVSRSRGSAGYACLEIGDFDRAVETLREVVSTADRMGLHTVAATARQNLGLALGRQAAGLGGHEGARTLAEARGVEGEAVLAFQAQQHRRMEAASRYYLALLSLSAGDPREAEDQARAALDLASHAPPLPPARAEALAVLAAVLLAAGRTEEALEAAQGAMHLLDELGGIDGGESLIRLVHALALRAAGTKHEARAAALDARDRVLLRAARISDPALRLSYLQRVPENARTLELANTFAPEI